MSLGTLELEGRWGVRTGSAGGRGGTWTLGPRWEGLGPGLRGRRREGLGKMTGVVYMMYQLPVGMAHHSVLTFF